MTSTDRFAYSTAEAAKRRARALARDELVEHVVEYDDRKPQPWRVLASSGQAIGPVPLNEPRQCTYIARAGAQVFQLRRLQREPADDHVIATLKALVA